jgi:hypothetical protein
MLSITHSSEAVDLVPIQKVNKIYDLSSVDGRIEYAMDFFKEKNYSDVAAAGIVGNLIAEGRNLKPNQKQIGGGPGRGILQWTKERRWASLKKWAHGRDLNPLDFKTQIAYIDHELKAYDSRGEIDLKTYKASDDIEQATEMLMFKYVKPGKPRLEKRVEGADNALSVVSSPTADINTNNY